MTFDEFHAWFRQADAALDGAPPPLKLWWELKARLDAVASPPLTTAETVDRAAPAVPSTPADPVDDVIEDFYPGHSTVYEQAVTLLRSGTNRR